MYRTSESPIREILPNTTSRELKFKNSVAQDILCQNPEARKADSTRAHKPVHTFCLHGKHMNITYIDCNVSATTSYMHGDHHLPNKILIYYTINKFLHAHGAIIRTWASLLDGTDTCTTVCVKTNYLLRRC